MFGLLRSGGVRGRGTLRRVVLIALAVFMATSCSSLTVENTSRIGSEPDAETAVAAPAEPGPTPAVPPPAASEPVSPSPDTGPETAPDPEAAQDPETTPEPEPFAPGAIVLLENRHLVAGLRVGLITNQGAQVDGRQLADVLAEAPDIDLVALFAPEHGVRGTLGAGEEVPGGIDEATGVAVYSLYGATRAPTPEMLADIDILIYDLQDVGTRFYTYISTMGLSMQAAAEADIAFLVLDRPNPLAATRSTGFIREPQQESFVSQYPIPATYALTPAELALAIQANGWIDGVETLRLTVMPLSGWTPGDQWKSSGQPWVATSPGLPTLTSTLAYPGTVLFEATPLSFGRGTDLPFAQLGAPWIDSELLATELNNRNLAGIEFVPVSFTPEPTGAATPPQFVGEAIDGVRWEITDPSVFDPVAAGIHALTALQPQAEASGITLIDRPEFFDLLAGTTRLREAISDGSSAETITREWRAETRAFDAAMESIWLYERPR